MHEGNILNLNAYRLRKEEFGEFLIAKSKTGKPFIIGIFSYSTVYLIKHIPTKMKYALKRMEKNKIKEKFGDLNSISKEVEIHSKLIRKNICRLIYVYETYQDYFIILEYLNNKTLLDKIKDRKIKNEEEVFNLFIQILNGIDFLHKNQIIHRDIKPNNILLNTKNEIKISDFGLCNIIKEDEKRSTICGTANYIAPEVLSDRIYDKSADVWCLGIILYEMCHGNDPFNIQINGNKKYKIIKEEIINGHFNFGDKMIIDNWTGELVQLLKEMIVFYPKKRIKIEDIYGRGFVRKYIYIKIKI